MAPAGSESVTKLSANCSDSLPLPEWISWTGLNAPNTGRVVAALAIAVLLAVCVALLRAQQPTLSVAGAAQRKLSKREVLCCLTPAVWSLAVFAALLAAFLASGFYRKFSPVKLTFLAEPAATLNHPAEMAASGIWAATFCAVLIGALAVSWVSARVYWSVACRETTSVVRGLLLLAPVPIVGLAALGKFEFIPAFGSETSALLLCSTWLRNDLGRLGPTTDGLNVVAIAVVVIAVSSFCLLLWAVRASASVASRLLNAEQVKTTSEALVEWQRIARDARHIQTLMDYALYAGAAALVAGLLEVVATLSWSFAPFQSTAELKAQADLCKAVQPASAASAVPVLLRPCEEVQQQLPTASTIDDLRRFTRSIGIMFGAVFSSLLAAMYLPVALAQQELVELLHRTAPKTWPPDGASSSAATTDKKTRTKGSAGQGAAPTTEIELDRSVVQRVFNVLAALGPLAAAIVSSIFGL